MTSQTNADKTADILKTLEAEEQRIRKTILTDAKDFEELQSEWQERDSPAERNLREVEWNQYSALQEEMMEIADAKARLAEGKYGICDDCEEAIAEKRLQIMPTARKCIECQTETEKELGISGHSATL